VWALPKTDAGKESCAPTFCMHGAHRKISMRMRVTQVSCPRRMVNSLRAWLSKSCPKHFSNALGAFCLSSGPNLRFSVIFRYLSSNNFPHYFGNKIPPICKSFEASWIYFLFLESSQFFSCSWFANLHDFFMNYFKNPLKLLCFRKTKITDSNVENITKVLKSQSFKYSSFLLLNPTENNLKTC